MREIRISLDNSRKRVVITVIDQITREVIREIPSDGFFNLVEGCGRLKDAVVKEMDSKVF